MVCNKSFRSGYNMHLNNEYQISLFQKSVRFNDVVNISCVKNLFELTSRWSKKLRGRTKNEIVALYIKLDNILVYKFSVVNIYFSIKIMKLILKNYDKFSILILECYYYCNTLISIVICKRSIQIFQVGIDKYTFHT